MVNDEELLARACSTWRRASISETELHQGAQRVARRLRAQRRSTSSRTPWMLAGSVAAFMATLAYAGIGRDVEPDVGRGPAVAPIEASGAGAGGDSHQEHLTARAIVDEESRGASDRAPSSAESARDDRAIAAGPVDHPAHAPTPSNEAAVAAAPHGERMNTESSAVHPAPPASARDRRGQAQATGPGRSPAQAKSAVSGDDTSWRAVSDALAAGKHWRAEHLLTRLAERGGDANTRAKAKLGLGQLEASRGRCAKARQLALAVAGQEGIETKTVRRALELAARCLR